ncbi:hypothetical protein OIU84_010518 [Salix udensis]|uniref:N-acetyltransferase domain-containing protein n=1 Tax=Salix udensis TaxID=889485 RepID=A0AAD6JMV1_9ROSI|nr:hypothetical protein OIU84_010518 [Salix udensis]
MALLSSSPSLSITSPKLPLLPFPATLPLPNHSHTRSRSTPYRQPSTFGIQDHKRYLAEREFEALKERIAGKRTGFNRVSCLNATLPLSQLLSLFDDDLGPQCKFRENGEDRVVVGTLDVNQCTNLPDEISGKKPEGIEGQFARGYLSNVCVAKELHRNGLGYDIIAKSKAVAQKWGITDLYVHVAVNNEPAKQLYMKSGFVYENDEPAWQARFLDRPRRLLLWLGLPGKLLWLSPTFYRWFETVTALLGGRISCFLEAFIVCHFS